MDGPGALPITLPEAQAATGAFLAKLAGAAPTETHISAIYRGTDTVYKLKKAVRLGFLDFTRTADRKRFLERELELNAPFAPGLYRDVVPIGQGPRGLALGEGDPVDWVLRMARVPPGDFLDELAAAGRLDPPLLDALADAVAAMHAAQPPTGDADPVARMRAVIDGNAAAARDAGLDPAAVATWATAAAAALDAATPALQARAPLVRRAHGDLHLGNLLLWQGRPAPFDALEFDEALATIDPGYDLAFLLMDLERRLPGHPGRTAANRVLCRYVARTGDAGLVAGLPLFLSLRATIRAHVQARTEGRNPASGHLLNTALAYLRPGRPVLLAVGGLMGSGKSTLARAVAPGLGPAPGALVIRSDETRKRLHDAAPEQPLPPSAYTPGAHARTAASLLAAARTALAGGHAVVLDATFQDPALAAAAQALGAPFLGIWLHAPLAELERRVAARRHDASDANPAVLRAAAATTAPPPGWTIVDATDREAARRQVQTSLDLI